MFGCVRVFVVFRFDKMSVPDRLDVPNVLDMPDAFHGLRGPHEQRRLNGQHGPQSMFSTISRQRMCDEVRQKKRRTAKL